MNQSLTCRILTTGPFDYEIRIRGELDSCWQAWFGGLQLENEENGQALLSGLLPDQAALHGVLSHIRDLNLILISVNLRVQN
jgi:hypothetical protein